MVHQEEREIRTVFPSRGSLRGGLAVSISGNLGDAAWDCSFGGALTPSLAVGRGRVECVAPAGQAGVAQVLLVSRESGWKTNALPFLFLHPVEVLGATPSSTPLSGGSVEVRGVHFTPWAECRFGTSRSSVDFVSSTLLRCLAPAAPYSGPAPITVKTLRTLIPNT